MGEFRSDVQGIWSKLQTKLTTSIQLLQSEDLAEGRSSQIHHYGWARRDNFTYQTSSEPALKYVIKMKRIRCHILTASSMMDVTCWVYPYYPRLIHQTSPLLTRTQLLMRNVLRIVPLHKQHGSKFRRGGGGSVWPFILVTNRKAFRWMRTLATSNFWLLTTIQGHPTVSDDHCFICQLLGVHNSLVVFSLKHAR